jgi:transmembrane sensor
LDESIIQVLRGVADPSVTERVRRWRAQSEENEARFGALARLWSLTEPAAADEVGPPIGTDMIVAAAEERRRAPQGSDVIPLDRGRRRPRVGRSALRWSVALAAGIAAVAVGLRMGVLAPGPQAAATYVASAGGPSTVVLEDGSFVKLAPGSALDVWDSRSERRVGLRGRAFFAVTHVAGRPFAVEAGGTETRVLGTRFEVADVGGGAVRTVVVEGRVAVSNERGSVEVSAGSLARTDQNEAPTLETPEDIYALLDWPAGVLLFQGTPLSEVAREVALRFGQRVEVRGEALGALRISGTFEEEGFEEVLLALCETAGAECALTAEGAVIGR